MSQDLVFDVLNITWVFSAITSFYFIGLGTAYIIKVLSTLEK